MLDRGSEIMANRTRALISVIFNFAIEREIVEYSPVTGVRRPAAERRRDRVLSEEEIRTLWEALELEHLTISGLFRFLLLTAQRNEETRLTRWEHLEDGVWRIPAENTKNGRAHSVALSPQSLAVLEPLRNGKSPWVFASPSSRSKGPILWVSHACIRLKKRCGFDFRPHDLRRTAASGMAALGTSRETLSKILNHKSADGSVTAIDDRYDREAEMRRALFAWGSKLEAILDQKSPKVFRIG